MQKLTIHEATEKVNACVDYLVDPIDQINAKFREENPEENTLTVEDIKQFFGLNSEKELKEKLKRDLKRSFWQLLIRRVRGKDIILLP